MIYDAIVIGGGVAGLTTAAYLSKSGHSTCLLEKEARCGGLVNSFERNGFTFDAGVRALENAGALFPMLKQLGIDLEFVKNHVSIGIQDRIMHVDLGNPFENYQALLTELYPESQDEISKIIKEIKQITRFMDIQYGIDNPLFLDIKEDWDYFIKKVFPWMFKYAITAPRVTSKNEPVITFLEKFTKNQALLDIITQHFFPATPAYFALSYFTLYQDYYYPKNGTGELIDRLVYFILDHSGEIKTESEVVSIDLEKKAIQTANDEAYRYRQLCWAADQKGLYKVIDTPKLADPEMVEILQKKRKVLADLSGNESVLTLYLSTSLPSEYFKAVSEAHFFYTPSRKGLSLAGSLPLDGDWDEIKGWLDRFFALTTYEISIPVLRNTSLAPDGMTGLIISSLFSYQLSKYVFDQGWQDNFNAYVTQKMIETLNTTVYPQISENIIDSFISTPLTLQRRTGNTDGAITGWAFTNPTMPAESRLVKIANAVRTPIPDVTQAGQWTYSPSGFPVSLITGKLAADRIEKCLK